jgi:hypothetical protein
LSWLAITLLLYALRAANTSQPNSRPSPRGWPPTGQKLSFSNLNIRPVAGQPPAGYKAGWGLAAHKFNQRGEQGLELPYTGIHWTPRTPQLVRPSARSPNRLQVVTLRRLLPPQPKVWKTFLIVAGFEMASATVRQTMLRNNSSNRLKLKTSNMP